MPQQGNLGIATVRVGGHEYPAVAQRNCKTCCSTYRAQIERDTVSGRSWKNIAQCLPDDANLTERNLADHFRNGHLPVDAEATHLLAEQQAEERGAVVAAGAARVVDYLQFAQTVVGRVNERVATGEVEPGISDGLRAADLLARFDPGPRMDEADYVQAFVCYTHAAKTVMSSEQYEEFQVLCDADEALQDLARR